MSGPGFDDSRTVAASRSTGRFVMKMRWLGCSVLLLTGCQSIEGAWEPGCDAFAGDRIMLEDGRYTWDKFTDARRVDADGRPVDPYPDFPRRGNFAVRGDAIVLLDDDGQPLRTYYPHTVADRVLLLDENEHATLVAVGEVPDCPLVRRAGDGAG